MPGGDTAHPRVWLTARQGNTRERTHGRGYVVQWDDFTVGQQDAEGSAVAWHHTTEAANTFCDAISMTHMHAPYVYIFEIYSIGATCGCADGVDPTGVAPAHVQPSHFLGHQGACSVAATY